MPQSSVRHFASTFVYLPAILLPGPRKSFPEREKSGIGGVNRP